LVDVVDRVFTDLPSDTLGFYYLGEDGLFYKLTYSAGSMDAIGVDKDFLDFCAASRNLSHQCFEELRKITDKIEYLGIDSVDTRGDAYQTINENLSSYGAGEWPFNINTNVGFFRMAIPGSSITNTWTGYYAHSIPDSWFADVVLPYVVNEEFTTLRPELSSGLKYYDNLGHEAPSSQGARVSVSYGSSKSVDFSSFSVPFSWEKTVSPADPFWSGGWGVRSIGAFVQL
jgi:hypothetical protein